MKALDAVAIPLWAISVIYFYRYNFHKGVDPANRDLHRQMLEIVAANTSVEEKQAGTRKTLDAFRKAVQQYFQMRQDSDEYCDQKSS